MTLVVALNDRDNTSADNHNQNKRCHQRVRSWNSNILLITSHDFSAKDVGAKEGPNQDTDDNVPVEIHCQKHDKVSNGKLQRMDEGAKELLKSAWPRPTSSGFTSRPWI